MTRSAQKFLAEQAADVGAVEPLTYSIEITAQLLGIGRNQAYEAAKRGDIPAIRIGKRLLVPKAALDRMLGIDCEVA